MIPLCFTIKKLNTFILFSLLILIISCASKQDSGTTLNYVKDCDIETRILKSYGDTIRIEYKPSGMDAADNMALDYCLENRGKISTKNEVSCEGCCKATYICKSNDY
ncbi:MAG: hypothetical protein CMM95_01895 [Rickettsiales bacterium]|nr:hypothetical protein [Rickettsiales bacterium]|tara:strand:- start:1723 stop:2043 length:321 start_codon:yes stop_codon:yes gene_type:complete